MKTLIPVALFAAATVFAPQAHADERLDKDFLHALSDYATIFDGPGTVGLAKAVCEDLRAGDAPEAEAKVLQGLGISPDLNDDRIFVELSSDFYCPEINVNGALPLPRKI